MNKSKNEETLGLHHVPFTIMWMAIAAVIFTLMFFAAYTLITLEYKFDFLTSVIDWLVQDATQLTGVLMGVFVGVLAAIGQMWLLRQRYGSAPKYWPLMTILGWGWAGHGMMILIDYQLSQKFGVYGMFAWFIIPVIFQMIALWSYVRGAWLYALAGTAAAFIATLGYTPIFQYYEDIYSLLFGTIAHVLFTALVIMALMARQRTANLKSELA